MVEGGAMIADAVSIDMRLVLLYGQRIGQRGDARKIELSREAGEAAAKRRIDFIAGSQLVRNRVQVADRSDRNGVSQACRKRGVARCGADRTLVGRFIFVRPDKPQAEMRLQRAEQRFGSDRLGQV